MVLPLLPQSSLSLDLHRVAQARLPLTFRITFPSPPRPSLSLEVTTPDSRSDGLNYYLFLFGFTTATRQYRIHRADSPGSRCPTVYTIYHPNTPVYLPCPWVVLVKAGGLGCWDREAPLHLKWPLLRRGLLDWWFLEKCQYINLSCPESIGRNIFGKGFVYSPGGEYRKLSSEV